MRCAMWLVAVVGTVVGGATLASAEEPQLDGAVIVGTVDTFDHVIAAHEHVLVEFCESHCRQPARRAVSSFASVVRAICDPSRVHRRPVSPTVPSPQSAWHE